MITVGSESFFNPHFSDILNGLGIVAGIVIAAMLTPRQVRKAGQRDQRERLLRTLINTWTTPANAEYQSSISLIPIDFGHNDKVMAARKALLDAANKGTLMDPVATTTEGAPHDELVDLQASLIATIAEEIGIKLTKKELLDGVYVTKGFVDRETKLMLAIDAWPKIADELNMSNRISLHVTGILPMSDLPPPPPSAPAPKRPRHPSKKGPSKTDD